MKTPILVIAAIATFFSFIGCSKTDPLPGVTNAISYKLNGTDYASPASFALTTQTVPGTSATLTEVAITSVNSDGTTVSMTFGFTSAAIAAYAGYSTTPVNIYNLANIPNSAYKGTSKATGGTLNISRYDGVSLDGTFSFTGSNFTFTNGVLTNTKKL